MSADFVIILVVLLAPGIYYTLGGGRGREQINTSNRYKKNDTMRSVILAGGSGTRLWPLSREYYPKQFLQIKETSLFQQTYQRALQISDPEEITVVTSHLHKYLVINQVEELGYAVAEHHLLSEPCGRNTLPAISWAMKTIRDEAGESTAAIFPSDHILDSALIPVIAAAEPLARDNLVTFGITPTEPHTGYGYIKKGKSLGSGFAVQEFREKPDLGTARRYLKEGYLWNSGIFLFSTRCFFTELKKHCPEIFAAFQAGVPEYRTLPSLSIDYGLLERSDRVAVVPVQGGWRDLGTFRAVYEAELHDADGNTGTATFINSHRNYLHARDKRVAFIDVDNLIVVDTTDALLVCSQKSAEKVKDLVQRLEAENDPITKLHLQVHRPWGSYTILEQSPYFKIKRITVKPKKSLSLQLHYHRSEHWTVVSGTADVELNGETRFLRQGESTFVKSGIRHRLKNPGVIPLEVIEVSLGEYLDESDIVRFDDEYGRI
jgi:mannose-1-phosphate guanylyltransferase/mannose-6-phosphate isomerase